MTIYRPDFWQEPQQFNPREFGPRTEWFDDQPAAIERADQLRAKGVFTVGLYVVDTEVGATYDIPRVEAEVLTQPIELPYAIKPVTQAPPQPPDPFRPRKGLSGPAWTFHLFGYGLLVALILGGLVERLA